MDYVGEDCIRKNIEIKKMGCLSRMETAIRTLIVDYGLLNVQNGLQEITKEFKRYISNLSPQPVKQEPVKQEPVKKEKPVKKKKIVKQEPEKQEPGKQEKEISSKEKKAVHADRIFKKRAEILSTGDNPIRHLTEENMKEWISQNMSYWAIAEQTGCFDYEVSNKAKEYNLKSPLSKIIASKKMSH